MSYVKPAVDPSVVDRIAAERFGARVRHIRPLSGGNLSTVFAFDCAEGQYVIHFSALNHAFAKEPFLADLLCAAGVPYPLHFGRGAYNDLTYSISQRMEGRLVAEWPVDRQKELLPDLVAVVTKMHQADVGATAGYGWLRDSGNGMYDSWEKFVVAFYDEKQTGTFWENWTDLFRSTCLEKDVFEECYSRLMDFLPYNAPHRYFVHGDCHPWNLLSDGTKITGVIDPNSMYGDFLIDISVLAQSLPETGIVDRFLSYYERTGVDIPDFKERLIGATYFKGLDGLRFYAKMGRKHDYDHLRNTLLNLVRG
ncbi:MAG: hypothetical protein K0Q59_2397 [Paenibacillus sp.]|jgi:hygromycin-B 4-O-kinase|nr:hypothetical protein [Paenibacillus sp.]